MPRPCTLSVQQRLKRGVAQPQAVDDAGVVELVRKDQIPAPRQRRKDASDMAAIKRRQDARRLIEKQQELEDLIKELSL